MTRWRTLAHPTGVLIAVALALGCSRNDRDLVGEAPPRPHESAEAGASLHPGAFPRPKLVLAADRLHERVDGAEPKLRSLGCEKLTLFRLQEPAGDLEVLRFDGTQGPTRMLADEAGPDRSQGVPGDEGFIGRNVLYFRQGHLYVRLITDTEQPRQVLLAAAARFERALTHQEVLP